VIREKHLAPGRVIEHRVERQVAVFDKRGFHVRNRTQIVWERCMVISNVPLRSQKRRHAASRLVPFSWHILVMWLDNRQQKLELVTIQGIDPTWRLLW
jgi:hypothetical protein